MTFAARTVGSLGGGVVNPINVSSIGDLEVSPSSAQARITFESDGRVTYIGNFPPPEGRWYDPPLSGIGAVHWIRATLTAGTNPTSGTMGTWLSLSAGQFWQNFQAPTGARSSTITFEIATDSSGTNIVATKTGVVIDAESST